MAYGYHKITLIIALFVICQVYAQIIQQHTSRSGINQNHQKGILRFSSNVFKKLANKNPSKNLIFSPISLGISLGFLQQYINNNEQSKMENALQLNSYETKEAYSQIISNFKKIKVLNLLISDGAINRQNIPEEFKMKLYDKYNPGQINKEISDLTNGNIKELLSIDRPTEKNFAYLINAVSYKGEWLKPFDKSKTVKSKFSVSKNKNVDVSFMTQDDDFYINRNDNLNMKWLKMHLTSEYSMTIILPTKGKTLESVLDNLNEETLRTVLEPGSASSVIVNIPKFTLKGETNLNSLLKEMNLNFLTKPGVYGIRSDEIPLTLKSSFQRTYLNVDEKGASAGAATVLGFNALSIKSQFNVDQPFLAIIADEQNHVPIIMAKIVDPTKH